jgi:type VI protein secretion system component Hcp
VFGNILRRPGHRSSSARRPARRQARPRLECLEDRTLPQASAVALAATPNPSTFGQQVTFTATVSSNDNSILQGTITFQDGTIPLVTLPVTGGEEASEQIVFPTPTSLTVGTHAITATYNAIEALPNSGITSNTVMEVVNAPPSPQSAVPSPTPTPTQPSATIALTLFNKSPAALGSLTFDVSAYHFSVINPTAVGKATGGAAAGKVQFNDFVLDLPISSVSPLLLQALVRGTRFRGALVSVATPDGKPFLDWNLRLVTVTRFRLMPQGSGDAQAEVDLTFGLIAGTVRQGQIVAGPRVAELLALQLSGVQGGFDNGLLALDSFALDAQNPSTGGNAVGGAGAGKGTTAALRGLIVELSAGEGTLPLFKAAESGGHFREGTLLFAAVRRTRDDLTLNLGTIFVSQFTESADVTAPEPVTDEANLMFRIVQVVETPVSADGKVGTPVAVSWNRVTNVANQLALP